MQSPGAGDIGFEDAMAGLAAIERNLRSGLFPTTGGALSLMRRSDVDLLRKSRKGAEKPFKPVLPDRGGARARGRAEWYIAAIEQALFHGSRPYDPTYVLAMDATLEDYRGQGVDWHRIHRYAARLDPRVPPFGAQDFWVPSGEPRTVRAFSARSPAATSTRRRWLIGLSVAAAGILVLSLSTARHWTKVDVPAQEATTHSEQYETGAYLVHDDGVSPCWIGQDWTDCSNLMVDQFNVSCAGVTLTGLSKFTCERYGDEVTRMQSLDRPGWYVTSLGDYGHLTKTPETATREVSNNDFRPAITHRATCYLGFVGECS